MVQLSPLNWLFSISLLWFIIFMMLIKMSLLFIYNYLSDYNFFNTVEAIKW